MNVRNLEQNSRILLDLSQSKENCDILIQSKNSGLIVKLIYDEWNELYEYCSAFKEKSNSKLSFIVFDNRKNLFTLLSRRLIARRYAEQALNNLILNEYETNFCDMKIELMDLIFKLVKFNENILEHLIEHLKKTNTDVLLDADYFSPEKIQLIKHILEEMSKQSSVDVLRRLNLIELGGGHVLCELIELLWIFDELNVIDPDELFQITLNCIRILNAFLVNTNNEKKMLDLTNQLCNRRHWLNTIYICLKKLLESESKKNNDLVNQASNLIKFISSSLNRSIDSNGNGKLDEKSLAIISFNEIKFAKLLTEHAVANDRTDKELIKSILSSLLNLSSLSLENKRDICHVAGLLAFLTELLNSDCKIMNRQLEEISISLLSSLSVYYSIDEQLRNELRNLNFFEILLKSSLCSSNLNVVACACNILWTMSARCKQDQELMFSLGAESALKALSFSSFDFISVASAATLKNLYSSNCNKTLDLGIFKQNLFNKSAVSLSSESSSSKSLNLSDSSSYSISSILTNRSRKQMIQTEKEMQRQLDAEFENLNFSESSSSSLSLTSSSSSSTLSMSSSSSSSSSLSCLCEKFNGKVIKNSYYINDRAEEATKTILNDNNSKKTSKHVTFSGQEVKLFDRQTSSCESLSNQEDNKNLNKNLNKNAESLLLFNNDLADSDCEIHSRVNSLMNHSSPALNLNFTKSNSTLLNDDLFSKDDSNCLIASCNQLIKQASTNDRHKYSSENKENRIDLILSSTKKFESNASLSQLLEPAKELINKMDAQLNLNDNSENKESILKQISCEKTNKTSKLNLTKAVQPRSTRMPSFFSIPPKPASRSSSIQRRILRKKSKSNEPSKTSRNSLKNSLFVIKGHLSKKSEFVN